MGLQFVAHDVGNLTTVAHLFPASRGRRGIYRLQFADGARYVGRTVDVVRRFGAHRKHHPDIVTLEFARATARADIAAMELAEIRAEQARGARLSNVVHGTADSLADADLDTIVTVAEQQAWLADGDVRQDLPQRTAFDATRIAGPGPVYAPCSIIPAGRWPSRSPEPTWPRPFSGPGPPRAPSGPRAPWPPPARTRSGAGWWRSR